MASKPETGEDGNGVSSPDLIVQDAPERTTMKQKTEFE